MKLISVIGPTASGKTKLAVRLAHHFNTAIISADSRQIYREMDIGTGKDLSEYQYNGKKIPYYLIDIQEAGYQYNLFEYQQDFLKVYHTLDQQQEVAILCGGSGLYIDAVVKGYELQEVPPNLHLRTELEKKSLEELTIILSRLKKLHNTTDIDTKKRAIRAIEIELFNQKQAPIPFIYPKIDNIYIGIDLPREERRARISYRLRQRMEEGMIEEVSRLLKKIPAENLMYYGLEYKFITLYLTGKLTYEKMISDLEIAIFQFAKRQMTFFRSMERKGAIIHWINGTQDIELLFQEALSKIIPFLEQPSK